METTKSKETAMQLANSFLPFIIHPVSMSHVDEIRDAMANDIQRAIDNESAKLRKALQDIIDYEDRGRAQGEPRISEKWYEGAREALKVKPD
jgi:hypothetical protein